MTERSICIIVPAAQLDNSNKVCQALGWVDPGFSAFVIRFSATGNEPVTHYGLNDNVATLAKINICTAFPENSGTLPSILDSYDWASLGITVGQAKAAAALMDVYTATTQDGGGGNAAFANAVAGSALIKVPDAGP